MRYECAASMIRKIILEVFEKAKRADMPPTLKSAKMEMVAIRAITIEGPHASMFHNLLLLCKEANVPPDELIKFIFRIGVEAGSDKILSRLNNVDFK